MRARAAAPGIAGDTEDATIDALLQREIAKRRVEDGRLFLDARYDVIEDGRVLVLDGERGGFETQQTITPAEGAAPAEIDAQQWTHFVAPPK